jgi:hypothetical protein
MLDEVRCPTCHEFVKVICDEEADAPLPKCSQGHATVLIETDFDLTPTREESRQAEIAHSPRAFRLRCGRRNTDGG